MSKVNSATNEPRTRGAAPDWRRVYSRRLALSDALVVIWVVFGSQIGWFGFTSSDVSYSGSLADLAVSYTTVSVILVAAWWIALTLFGTREYRVVGNGVTEYKLVADATIRLFGLIAIVAFLLKIDLARGYIITALPIGVATLLFERWMWRQWLSTKRSQGQFVSRVVLAGSTDSVTHVARDLARARSAGYWVVGVCVPGGGIGQVLAGTQLPVLGDVSAIRKALDESDADTVIITSADELPPERVRELSWSLEPGREHLVVAPSLTDIGGPRIHTRPVAGLPLIHVETPRYEGRKRYSKRVFDLVGSAALILLLSPIFLAVAVAVKTTSRGPVFYRQERIGLLGKPFFMLKFRSMVIDADSQLAALLADQGSDDKPLFKVRNDPRLTSVGAVLRKYSLDEFPQLLNVFVGDMSLVGPRPQRQSEVELYTAAAERRLTVQPGMTGLWQVSGRSELSWEDAIRLDLYYVENWSVTGDLIILGRTVKAVVAPGETAY